MRSLLLLAFMLPGLATHAQNCLRVIDAATGQPLPGAVALCPDGMLAGVADSTGRLCAARPCERLRIQAAGHEAVDILFATALALGSVPLRTAFAELAPVVVEPWPGRAERRALAAVDVLDSARLMGFERSGLRSAALFTPGVQWDQRGHGGSQRLSMRGSLLRSPFGVRGVKVYWGPFPLTLADGSTPLELLDPALVGSVDLVRSVGPPMYGSAPSGLLLAAPPDADDSTDAAMLEGIGGPYGYFRLAAQACTGNGGKTLTAGLVRQRSDGFRQQEWSARDQAFVVGRMRHRRGLTELHLTWQQASWALPGSLDSATAAADPRSARPYSVRINASLDKRQVMAGVANTTTLGRGLQLRSAVHAQTIAKLNPYGTSPSFCGYKDESVNAAGARISLSGTPAAGRRRFSWDAGLEALFERDGWMERTYVDGVQGDLRVDADTRVANLNVFLATVTRLGLRTTVHAGAGSERTAYDHRDRLAGEDNVYVTVPRLLPNIGLEHATRSHVRLHLRYAEAVSRPTVWELLGTAGRFNTGLRGEQVAEWQAGIASDPEHGAVHGSAQVYRRRVDGLIQEAAAPNGDDRVFNNLGSADLRGMELQLAARIGKGPGWQVMALANLTVQQASIAVDTGRVDHLPGSEPWRAAGLLQVHRGRRAMLELGVRRGGPVRPSFSGERTVPGATVLHLRASANLRLYAQQLEVFVHVENLADARYTSWVQVNDAGARYFNPAPGRSLFAGARLYLRTPRARRPD